MENNDYCAPEQEQNNSSDYGNPYNYSNTSYENPNYSNPNYTNNPYGQNPYGQSPYGQNQYGQNQYANLGGVMVDDKGRPLKNHFALKLVLSIIMILMCCFSPLVSILGIIGLVFTCMANSAYNQGNPHEFKTKDKVSTILLSIGGVIAALIIILYVVVIAFTFTNNDFWEMYGDIYDEVYSEMYGDLYGDDWEDEIWGNTDYSGSITEEYPGTNLTPLVEGFNQFTYNGMAYEVPMSYNTFLGMGYTLEAFDETIVFEAGDYEAYEFIISDDYTGVVRISNNSNQQLLITECEIDYICFYSQDAYDGVNSSGIKYMELYIVGELSIASEYEEFEKVLGTPYYVYTETDEKYGDFVTYQWLYEGTTEIQRLEISFFDGAVCDFAIDHYEY